MRRDNYWAILPDIAEDTLRELAEKEAAEKDTLTAKFGPKAFFDADAIRAETPPYSIRNGVAVIEIAGPIDRKARISFWTGLPYTAGQEQIRAGIEAALADPEVSAILLSIDSPGGVVAGTKELADFIAAARREKPIAAYADGLCASAAFWLAAATGQIFSPKTAQVGSIGVIAVLTDWTRATEKAGITRTVIHSGKWKAAGSPDKALTDEERALFQGRLSALHEIFVGDVARHLQISPSASPPYSSLPTWAEGQTFLAEEALSLGLISQIVNDRNEAISILQKQTANGESFMTLAELKAEHPELVKELSAELAETLGELAAPKAAAEIAEARADAQKETLALITAIGGAELAKKAETLLAAHITPAQLETLAPFLKEPAAQAEKLVAYSPASSDEAARAEMLAALQKAQGEAVGAGPASKPASALLADAERRAKEARS